jgi:GNAT superfamily N-acetyltransferase
MDLEVRELREGEEPLWFELEEWPAEQNGAREERLAEFRTTFADRSAGDPRTYLIATERSRPVGRLAGVFLDRETYLVADIRCADGCAVSRVEGALLGYLAPSFARDGISVFTSDRPKNAELVGALKRAGFTIDRKKALVSRRLDDDLPEPGVAFAFRSLFDVGRDAYVSMMTEAAKGDPFENMEERDPEADFQELVEMAGEKFDPASWFAAIVEGETVGVVLPQVLPDDETEGTLFYVAVFPRFRGRGLGRALHAAGLAMLRERGVSEYFGSTDTRNEPMLRIFAANGCERAATQLFFKPPSH